MMERCSKKPRRDSVYSKRRRIDDEPEKIPRQESKYFPLSLPGQLQPTVRRLFFLLRNKQRYARSRVILIELDRILPAKKNR